MKWKRIRFSSTEEDTRPVIFPPPGPYWVTGYGDNETFLIAYIPEGEDLKKYWPEANLEHGFEQERDKITFTDRFPRPEWWTGEGEYFNQDDDRR